LLTMRLLSPAGNARAEFLAGAALRESRSSSGEERRSWQASTTM